MAPFCKAMNGLQVGEGRVLYSYICRIRGVGKGGGGGG